MKIKSLFVWILSLTSALGLTQTEIQIEYRKYLNLFNKKETLNSFEIFSDNYRRVYSYNYFQNRFFLTQHSDQYLNEFVSLPHMYVYLLGSRKGKEVLICS
jgi:hypothetical protein